MNRKKCSKCKDKAIVSENDIKFCVPCYREFVFNVRYKLTQPNMRNPR